MPGRRDNNDKYRYGFNGKEKDDSGEWGSNTNYDYGFRIYNPSIGKFLSVDPLTKGYPWYTPYQFAGNMPIAAVDLDGLEVFFAANGDYIGKWGTSTTVRVIDDERVENFQDDLRTAIDNPDNWVQQNIMDFYWDGFSRTPNVADRENITIDHVIPETSHESYNTHNDCYTAACATLSNNDLEPGTFWAPDNQFEYQMFTATNSPRVDIEETRLSAFEKINSDLEDGNPLLIGVNYQDGSSNPNTDGTTDHFIVLTGRGFDNDGNLFYTGFENVDGNNRARGTSDEENRFYLQEDGTLQGGTVYTDNMTITQVRPVNEE